MNHIEAERGIQHWGLEEQVSSIYTAEGPTCCPGEKKRGEGQKAPKKAECLRAGSKPKHGRLRGKAVK